VSVGSLKVLITQLRAAPSMSGVNVQFGEEAINDESYAVPRVVVVPVGGSWQEPGYFQAADPALDAIWATLENVELYCLGFSTTPGAALEDHSDATEIVRANVLRALQWQRRNQDPTTGVKTGGLFWKPITGRWARFGDAFSRYGRGYVLTVQAEIAIPSADITNATLTGVTFTHAITPPG
jgi:hypothetical protein